MGGNWGGNWEVIGRLLGGSWEAPGNLLYKPISQINALTVNRNRFSNARKRPCAHAFADQPVCPPPAGNLRGVFEWEGLGLDSQV